MRRNRKKLIAALGVAVLVIALATAAFAYWTSTGTGTGSGSTTAGTSDLTYATTSLNAMYPGDSSQTFTVTVTNNSATQSEFVGGVSAYITTSNSGCTGADFLLDGVSTAVDAGSAVPLAWTGTDIGAGASQATAGTDTIQFNNTGAIQDACKGATVTLNYAS